VQHEFDVAFHSHGVRLAGRFIRNTDDFSLRQPTVVVTGSWLTVKEQMPLVYARRLADADITTFIFDFAGFGESDGAPRQCEMPARKIVDIASAADFVRTMSFVGKVGHLAICASAQYTLAALARGASIDAYACVAGWYHDAASVATFYGDKDGVDRRMARALDASRKFSQTGEPTLVPAYEAGNDRAGMFFPLDYYARAERGAVPQWKNEMDETSWRYWLTFDGMSSAPRVSTPTLLVHSDGCVLPDHVRQIHRELAGPKELAWSEGSQVDFYDVPLHVERAMQAVKPWFDRTLR
jgi:fermentation-respiration switch protein FrsA (DUF1100 family)